MVVPQKFGTQTEKGRVVLCFRNGDKHQTTGTRMIIHPTKIKTFDQFKTEMSRKVGLPTGPVLKVYSRDHKQVKSLEEFVDGEKYICCGAEKLNLDQLPAGLGDEYDGETTPAPPASSSTHDDVEPAQHEEVERKPVVSSYVKGTPEKFGTQTEKGRLILCFRNGDKHQKDGARVIIHPTKIKTFDQLKTELSRKVGLPTGPVLKVYGSDRKQVKALEDFVDGERYICTGAERLDESAIPAGMFDEDYQPLVSTSSSSSSSSLHQEERQPVVKSYSGKTPEKYGTQTEKGRIVLCFRNGDKHQKEGIRVVIHPTKIKTFDQFKTEMSRKVALPTGPVLKVYGRDHKQVKSLDDFVDGERYICAGAEKLNLEQLPAGFDDEQELASATSDLSLSHSHSHSSAQEESAEKKPVVSSYTAGVPAKFGTQTDKGKVIMVYRNGDKHHAGVRMIVHPTKFKTFAQLMEAMTKQVQLSTGAVRKVYTVGGKKLAGLEEIEDGGKYVATGAEALNNALMPTAAKE